MNQTESRSEILKMFSSKVALLLILSLLLWATGAPMLVNTARAAKLTQASDTLTHSEPSHPSEHVIRFTTPNGIESGETVSVELDPLTHSFSEIGSGATSTDIFFNVNGTDYTYVPTCAGAATTFSAIPSYNNGTNENLTFTNCGSATTIASSSVVTITVGSTTPLWYNPNSEGSWVIRLGGTMPDAADIRVATVSSVTLTASVDSTFTFTVTGLPAGATVNGDTTTGASTATTLPFGTLSPGSFYFLGQTLNVTTNASNGFVVTVVENQDPTSSSGDTIHLFKNGQHQAVPAAWTAPTNIINATSTWGHLGVTSSDDINLNEFSGSKFAGNFNATSSGRAIFSHFGPADGSTTNVGSTTVGYGIQIGSLQPAAGDYTNTLTYVATPTF